ncbi:type I restriction endonuclease [Escherichia coli]
MRTALQRLNPHLNEQKCEEALKQVMQIASPVLMVNNLTFHRLLTEGINIEVCKEGNTQGELAYLIHFNDSYE